MANMTKMLMSGLKQVVRKAMEDKEFAEMLQSNPSEATEGYELSEEEVEAIASGNAGKVSALISDETRGAINVNGSYPPTEPEYARKSALLLG